MGSFSVSFSFKKCCKQVRFDIVDANFYMIYGTCAYFTGFVGSHNPNKTGYWLRTLLMVGI